MTKALEKLSNIAWQALTFVSESLAMDKKGTPAKVIGKEC